MTGSTDILLVQVGWKGETLLPVTIRVNVMRAGNMGHSRKEVDQDDQPDHTDQIKPRSAKDTGTAEPATMK